MLITPLPNRNWESGNAYSTSDHVFIPSSTELGDSEHKFTYQIGNSYPYFSGASNAKRVAWLGVEKYWYWTRSPDFEGGHFVRIALDIGDYKGINAYHHALGVRPALNLKADTPVSEILN